MTSPLRKDTEISREYVSQSRAIQHIELRAQERGYLQGVFVDQGQFVKSGHKMFQIMPLLYQAEPQKAEAEAQFAPIEYQNTKVLADGTVVSPNELALAKAKMDKYVYVVDDHNVVRSRQIRFGRFFKVFTQAAPEFRRLPSDVMNLYVKNDRMLFGTIFGVIIVPGLYFIFGTSAEGTALIRDEERRSVTEEVTHRA